jgi:hypothetical protein
MSKTLDTYEKLVKSKRVDEATKFYTKNFKRFQRKNMSPENWNKFKKLRKELGNIPW